ncbi:MAG: zinc ribbon domain-containing protein [Calditrichaeota bacterium]|nr:MAG: zinc ribbon domain-containing protein [Calditrichota bacterium]
MPTYEYRCNSCGHHFEQLQRITAEPVRICPICGTESVSRVLSGGNGLIFKGSGFYSTDYKQKPAASKETKEPAKKTEE